MQNLSPYTEQIIILLQKPNRQGRESLDLVALNWVLAMKWGVSLSSTTPTQLNEFLHVLTLDNLNPLIWPEEELRPFIDECFALMRTIREESSFSS
jgi:aryl-alcohol dehydrogenase-like predicted oxidoreductase